MTRCAPSRESPQLSWGSSVLCKLMACSGHDREIALMGPLSLSLCRQLAYLLTTLPPHALLASTAPCVLIGSRYVAGVPACLAVTLKCVVRPCSCHPAICIRGLCAPQRGRCNQHDVGSCPAVRHHRSANGCVPERACTKRLLASIGPACCVSLQPLETPRKCTAP